MWKFQLYLTLCDPIDYTVHGILLARILEWVTVPFSRGSSQPRDQTQVSCIAGRFFTSWATREASVQFSTFQLLSHVWLCDPMDCSTPGFLVHHQLPEACSNSCPLNQWYHPTISPSVIPFSSCPQSRPASGSFQMSQFFTWGGPSIRVSASKSVLPMNTQDWSPLGWTGGISLQSKGLSRVFSNTTVQKHQFFRAQLFL